MTQPEQTSVSFAQKRFSLTMRVSLLLAIVTIFPLLIVVTSNDFLSRPALIAQAATVMSTDARTRVKLIDTYIAQRLQDVETFRHFTPIQNYMAGNLAYQQAAYDELATGHQLDFNYDTWSLFNPNGTLLQSYPTTPTMHGKYLLLPEILPQLRTINKSLISDIFYDATSHEASIDIDTPIIGSKFLGVLHVSLKLHYIWDIVNSELGANGARSYASIIDHNGINIAYTNLNPTNTNYSSNNPTGLSLPTELFKAIQPLSAQKQHLIQDENLYGNDRKPVTTLADPALASALHDTQGATTFSLTPTEQREEFEAAKTPSTILPWNYLVFSPLSTITVIANQQRLYAFMIALIVLMLAMLIGLLLGRRITSPILHSVNSLLGNSKSLKTLATKELSTATEQKWMVESSQVGLQSVQYYTKATHVAARRLSEVSTELQTNWQQLSEQTIAYYLEEVKTAAKYIENASTHQEDSGKKLATALHVTTHVNDQLASNAASTDEAAHQLETVVDQLRQVVGR